MARFNKETLKTMADLYEVLEPLAVHISHSHPKSSRRHKLMRARDIMYAAIVAEIDNLVNSDIHFPLSKNSVREAWKAADYGEDGYGPIPYKMQYGPVLDELIKSSAPLLAGQQIAEERMGAPRDKLVMDAINDEAEEFNRKQDEIEARVEGKVVEFLEELGFKTTDFARGVKAH